MLCCNKSKIWFATMWMASYVALKPVYIVQHWWCPHRCACLPMHLLITVDAHCVLMANPFLDKFIYFKTLFFFFGGCSSPSQSSLNDHRRQQRFWAWGSLFFFCMVAFKWHLHSSDVHCELSEVCLSKCGDFLSKSCLLCLIWMLWIL